MSKFQIIVVQRGALPSAPLNELPVGQSTGTVITQLFGGDEESTYEICLRKIQAGCSVTVTTPSGEEWNHEHILSVLKSRSAV